MSYLEELKEFKATHTYSSITVGGGTFRYVSSGKKDGKTLVLLNGGMVSQIYVQKYHGEVGGLILISTGGMDAATIKSLKKKYFLAPLMLFYMKHCNYEKLKQRLIKAGMGHIRNESEAQASYAREMFETIFKDYKKEKDLFLKEQ